MSLFRPRQVVLACLTASLAAFAPAAARASSLQVSPIYIDFQPADQTQTLWLSNTGDEDLHAQVRVFAWSQSDGKDVLTPTRDVAASPPIVAIDAHGRQLVRLVRLAPVPPAESAEQSYRLLVNEIPVAGQKPHGSGLQFLLQYSIPVFLTTQPASTANASSAGGPTAKATVVDTSRLELWLRRTFDGHAKLTVRNSGTSHIKISDLVYIDAHGTERVLVVGLLGYVLAGDTMSWPVDLPPTANIAHVEIKARLNDEPNAQELHLVDSGD